MDTISKSLQRKKQAARLNLYRRIHRWMGASLFVLFILVSITGLLLGWKKNSNGYLLAPTQKGTSTDIQTWKTLHELAKQAEISLHKIDPNLNAEIDRMEVRADKGIVKFTFVHHYIGLQIDGATGKLLSAEERRSDWIEHLHDGSWIDKKLGTTYFKLLFTTLAGTALLLFSLTGFGLWYIPKRMRKNHK